MTLLTLLIFLFPLAYSPGPGNLFFAAIGASLGWRAAIPALTGYHLATLLAALAVGAGMLVATGTAISAALTFAGTGYMLWLAWKLWNAGAIHKNAAPLRAGFTDGAALLALNPKAWSIMAALFALYGDVGWATTVTVALIFTLNNLVAFVVWTLAGQRLLRQTRYTTQIHRVFAVLLTAVALHMALN